MHEKQRILVLGAKGMLGQELVRVFGEDERYDVIGWDREDIDVTNFPEAEKKIREAAPDVLFNAVAYNAVDVCEENDDEYQRALLLNAEAPKFLARLAKELDILFVHYSTDYVFGRNEKRDGGFDEDTEPIPVCRYAISKREGEKNVQAVNGKYYIIRLSKLFGKPALSEAGKKSFFEVMLGVGKEKLEVNVVDDEVSCFTYASDLASTSKELAGSGDAFGIYHLVNEFPVTWYDGVLELFKQVGLDTKVIPVSSDTFPRPAKRPVFSVLKNTKRPLLRPYQEALKEFLNI